MNPTYKVNEIFYSIQGEGHWTGTPMFFIRLYGCNLKCTFCDTPEPEPPLLLKSDDILTSIKKLHKSCNRVCITGGEPLLQDIYYLRDALEEEGYLIHLETNGTYDIPTGLDWVTISPKNKEISGYNILVADEIRFLVGCKDWEDLIAYYDNILSPNNYCCVSPLDITPSNIKLALEFSLNHSKYSLSIQMHKFLNIR